MPHFPFFFFYVCVLIGNWQGGCLGGGVISGKYLSWGGGGGGGLSMGICPDRTYNTMNEC